MKHTYFFAILVLFLLTLVILNFGSLKTYQLFFYNESVDKNLNGGSIACDDNAVVPVLRKTRRTISIEKILKSLIEEGPLPDEQVEGFASEFPHQGFAVQKIEINNGILNITLNEIPGFTSGGACRVGLLRSQIEKTALQFKEIKEVKILPEEILQP